MVKFDLDEINQVVSNKGIKMFKITNLTEHKYQGNKVYTKFNIILGINEYNFVVYWGPKSDLENIKSPKDLFETYKFFSKINEYNGKSYINYVLTLPKLNK